MRENAHRSETGRSGASQGQKRRDKHTFTATRTARSRSLRSSASWRRPRLDGCPPSRSLRYSGALNAGSSIDAPKLPRLKEALEFTCCVCFSPAAPTPNAACFAVPPGRLFSSRPLRCSRSLPVVNERFFLMGEARWILSTD